LYTLFISPMRVTCPAHPYHSPDLVTLIIFGESRDSSVGIALDYGLDDRGPVHGRGWVFFSSPPHPDWLWGPPSFLSNGYRG
jgi:hypothetical protein